MTKLAVVGIGKLGLPIATYFASKGATVVGVDIDASMVEQLTQGVSPIGEEPGVDENLADLVSSGSFRATTDVGDGVASADVVIITVPLVTHGGEPDYRHLDAAVGSILHHLQEGALVVFETTLPVGVTRQRFLPELRKQVPSALVAFSPERVSSGRIWRDLDTYPKLVGGVDAASTEAAVEFYRTHLDAEVWAMDSAEAAELTKLAETTYRDINIAFANELAIISDDLGVDVTAVIEAANSQPYSHIHRPGIGVGGHCIPHYPHLLQLSTVGSDLAMTSRRLNDAMPTRMVDVLRSEVGPLEGRTVVLLGVAYRPGVPETASSPAFDFRDAAAQQGAVVLAVDPLFTETDLKEFGFSPWDGSPPDAFVLVTDHPEYKEFDFGGYPSTVVIDGRNALDAQQVEAAGHRYRGTGRWQTKPVG
ncbi:MAG: nucleotide sugar dehydrogenase [Acidimicrobiia bacterium]|nr:nucleotide sugar dehydrogenase [Acidimicrobiia bacterium]